MTNPITPAAGDDENPYSRDTVSVLLKTATWYVRLRRPQKVERLVGMAIDLVENRGGMLDVGLNRLLDDYANTFRRLKRPVVAGQLAELAQRVRASFPGEFTLAGDDVPWWLQENFISRAPALPVEFHSSHAEEPDEWGVAWVAAVTFAVTLPIAMILSISIEAITGAMFLLAITIIPIVAGIVISRSHRRAVIRQGAESWVRVTADGVQYHEPNKSCDFRWTEIRHVWTSWQSGPAEDVTYPSVVVVGPHDEFEMSARFFTEQQVHWVNGLCKLHSGQKTFEDWREAPR
jgi:hypothetical protein